MSTYDPTDIRKLEREQKEQETQSRLERETDEGDWKWLMSQKRGRRIIWRLLSFCGPFTSSFDTNALRMAFQEGQRNVGNMMLAKINALCPEHYVLMSREAREAKNGRSSDDGSDRTDKN